MKNLLRNIFLKIRINDLKTDLLLSAIVSISIFFLIFDFHIHLNGYQHPADLSAFTDKSLLSVIV